MSSYERLYLIHAGCVGVALYVALNHVHFVLVLDLLNPALLQNFEGFKDMLSLVLQFTQCNMLSILHVLLFLTFADGKCKQTVLLQESLAWGSR
jgi:hypothetical protein